MLLKDLIKNLPKEKKKIRVKGLSIDSKKTKQGFIFFAIKGNKFNGEKYISEAIKKGSIAIVCSKTCNFKSKKIPIIRTSNVRYSLSEFCSKFYRFKPKNIIAITGTNGKTSVADLFYQILSLNKIPVASIGTLGVKYKNKILKSSLTSPDTILLHQLLEKIKKNRIDNVIIEASSHGLHQNRIEHLNLKAGIFTNFSQDHLDYHKTMRKYLNAKLHLFKNILKKNRSVISDSNIKEFSTLEKITKKRRLRLIDSNKIRIYLEKKNNLNLNKLQYKNLSMAIAAAKISKLKSEKIYKSLFKIRDVNGRLELIKTFHNNIRVFVDFAHTPDALLKTLNSMNLSNDKNISLVFGCGGDRDKKKRALMGKIASSNCKKIYVTDDNPRNEKPEKIRKEIINNIDNKNCFNIGNRVKAIKTAILNAESNEIILVAGKGHESEQIYKKKIINISDKEIIKKLNIRQKKFSHEYLNFVQNKKILSEITKFKKATNFHGLAIDSRVLKKNNLFLTIKGKNNDGLKFIPKALKKGASYIISSKKIKRFKSKLIKVDNETKFLNDFALKKRNFSSAKIIAITGSAGKTSLKNLSKKLLQNFQETFCSPKSYNNHFGVPLSLSNLKTKYKYCILEVGMSKAGEINLLTKLIRPHIAIITNVGEAHIENFNNLKGIAKAKGEIINNVENGGTVILNRDDKYFNYFQKKTKKKNLKILTFGFNKKSNIYPVNIKKNDKKIKLRVKTSKYILDFEIKNINIYNVLSSIALMEELGLNLIKAVKYYKNFQPSEGRGKIHNVKRYKKSFKLIDESYNANPLSVKNAINNFKSIKKVNFKKYLLLGDMLELGEKSDNLHKDISKVINSSDIDKVFIKGNKTLFTYKNINKNKRGNIFQQEEDLDFTLNKIIANNDYLMIKGSNATGLNNFTKKIIKGL